MSYLKELLETFEEKPVKILCTSFLIWVILPVIVFALGGILLIIQIISLDKFTILLSNALIPWWTSIIINFKVFVLEYLILTIITIILVHHEVIETIDFNELIERLKNLNRS